MASNFVITNDRAVEEWLSLFDDPIVGNSRLDWLAHASFQTVIEGPAIEKYCRPAGSYWAAKEGIDLEDIS